MTNELGSEFNILGCQVRLQADSADLEKANAAISVVQDEIDTLKTANPSLKDTDLAVLCALKIATKAQDLEAEYKDNIISLKSGIEEALNFIEDVSTGGNLQGSPNSGKQ